MIHSFTQLHGFKELTKRTSNKYFSITTQKMPPLLKQKSYQ